MVVHPSFAVTIAALLMAIERTVERSRAYADSFQPARSAAEATADPWRELDAPEDARPRSRSGLVLSLGARGLRQAALDLRHV